MAGQKCPNSDKESTDSSPPTARDRTSVLTNCNFFLHNGDRHRASWILFRTLPHRLCAILSLASSRSAAAVRWRRDRSVKALSLLLLQEYNNLKHNIVSEEASTRNRLRLLLIYLSLSLYFSFYLFLSPTDLLLQ